MPDKSLLERFDAMRDDAVKAVTDHFLTHHEASYNRFGWAWVDRCREDTAFHLDFLRSSVELGSSEPFLEYLRWAEGMLAARSIPREHLSESVRVLATFFGNCGEPFAGTVVPILNAAVREFDDHDRLPDPRIEAGCPLAWDESDVFEAVLLKGDSLSASQMIEAGLKQGKHLIDIEMHVVQPALYRIGSKWQRNEISVVQEHIATAIAQVATTLALSKVSPAPPTGRKAALACVQGNYHALGLQMVADAFRLHGWDVDFLGGNVPTNALIRHVGTSRPDALALSVSLPQQLRAGREVIAGLQALGPRRPVILLGGLAINQFRPLVEHLGADGFALTAASAVAEAARVLDSRSNESRLP